jgi:hypothetical protein
LDECQIFKDWFEIAALPIVRDEVHFETIVKEVINEGGGVGNELLESFGVSGMSESIKNKSDLLALFRRILASL